MNAMTSLFSTRLPRPPRRGDAIPLPAPLPRRERDFGVGYGTSSGYAAAARYAPVRSTPRFRFS